MPSKRNFTCPSQGESGSGQLSAVFWSAPPIEIHFERALDCFPKVGTSTQAGGEVTPSRMFGSERAAVGTTMSFDGSSLGATVGVGTWIWITPGPPGPPLLCVLQQPFT